MAAFIDIIKVGGLIIFAVCGLIMIINLIDDRKYTWMKIESLVQNQDLEQKFQELRCQALENMKKHYKEQEKKLTHKKALKKYKISVSLATYKR